MSETVHKVPAGWGARGRRRGQRSQGIRELLNHPVVVAEPVSAQRLGPDVGIAVGDLSCCDFLKVIAASFHASAGGGASFFEIPLGYKYSIGDPALYCAITPDAASKKRVSPNFVFCSLFTGVELVGLAPRSNTRSLPLMSTLTAGANCIVPPVRLTINP